MLVQYRGRQDVELTRNADNVEVVSADRWHLTATLPEINYACLFVRRKTYQTMMLHEHNLSFVSVYWVDPIEFYEFSET